MDFIQNFLVLIILNSCAFLFADREDLDLKSSVEKTDSSWHKRHGSSTNMMCGDHKCHKCIENYKWDEDERKCLKKCSHHSICPTNRHCDDGNCSKLIYL
jgi:hypothetical protein